MNPTMLHRRLALVHWRALRAAPARAVKFAAGGVLCGVQPSRIGP
jgi:hypothetical protein